MSAPSFLADFDLRSVPLPAGSPFEMVGLALGQGASPLEGLAVTSAGAPRPPTVRALSGYLVKRTLPGVRDELR